MLFNNLLKSLPKNIRYAVKSKKELKTGKSAYTEYILKKAKWIEYNKYTINFLILDIDIKYKFDKNLSEEENIELAKKYYPYTSVKTILNYIKTETFLPIPTWILETDKGFQIAWQLKVPFPTNYKSKSYKYGLYILKNLSLYFGADQNAVRLKGIWRNPLLHRHIYTGNTTELAELEVVSEIKKEKKKFKEHKKIKHKIMHIDNEEFWQKEIEKRQIAKQLAWKIYEGGEIINLSEGVRNNTLWYYGMILARYKEKNILQKLLEINKITGAFLDKNEIENIYTSIMRYKKEGKLYISKKSKNYDPENIFQCGKGNYSTWTKEEKKYYINNYRINKGIVKKSNIQKAIERNKKIEKAIEIYKNPSIKEIALITGYSSRYIRKIIKNSVYYEYVNYFTKEDLIIKKIIKNKLKPTLSITKIKETIKQYKHNAKNIDIFINLFLNNKLCTKNIKNNIKKERGDIFAKTLSFNKDNILCMFTFCSLNFLNIKYILNINYKLNLINNINNIFLKDKEGPP